MAACPESPSQLLHMDMGMATGSGSGLWLACARPAVGERGVGDRVSRFVKEMVSIL